MKMRVPSSKTTLWSVGIGAGLAGATWLATKYAFRPLRRPLISDAISPGSFRTKVVETSQGDVLYHEAGSGPPLLFIHGVQVGASSYEWSKVYPHFVSDHRVIAVDLLGFGESERPSRMIGVEEQEQSLAEFVRLVCGRQAPIIIGSNIGAGLAVLLASHHPDLATRLILLMPTGLTEFGGRRLPWNMALWARLPIFGRALYAGSLARRKSIKAWLERYGFSNPDKVQDEHIEVMATCAQQVGAEHSILALLRKHYHFDFLEHFQSLVTPVVLLWADRSSLSPLEWAYRLMAVAPKNTSLHLIREAGLLAALEQPESMVEMLRQQTAPKLRVVQPRQ